MALDVKIQQKINAYRQTHPKVKMSDEQIVSILVKNGEIVLTEDQKRSLFTNNSKHNDNIGLKLEKTAKKPNPEKTIYLQSGRKVVYSKLSNGKTVMKYYGADGNRINPDYFKKVEGQISISADGNSYTVTKNGKKQTLKAKNPTQGAIDQNIAKLNNQEKALNKAKKEQGWIGKGWDWFKNKTGIGDGSNKAQQQINAERKLLKQIKTGKISKKDFKETTGLDYTKENLAKFQKGELSQAETKINGYKEGQDMATDMVGDMVSGIAAVGIYTVAVAAAPVTGGASLLVGFGLATASGAAIKVGIKALDTVGTDKKYTLKDLKHDAATGAFSGGLAPVTAGLGGAVGKTVATKFGVQAIKTVGKEVAEEAAKGGVKSTLKAALANPAGYEYVGGTFAKRTASMAAEMATDGALGGAIDGGFRAGLDSDWDAETMLDGAIEGGVGGALFAPVIGGGMKALGKGAQKAFGKDNVKIDANGKKVADETPTVPEAQGTKETSNGNILEGGIKDTELDEVAPFAQRLEKTEKILNTEKEIKRIKTTLSNRVKDKTSTEENVLIQDIINKITPDNFELINTMLADKDISNETIFRILDSCKKPYKIGLLGFMNPVNIPIYLLQHFDLFPNIEMNSKVKSHYAKVLLDNKNVPRDAIAGILQNIDGSNIKLVKAALNNENFDFKHLPAILRNTLFDSGYYANGEKTASSTHVKFAETLINNPDFPQDCIADITFFYGLENVNRAFTKQLCEDSNFPKQQISNLLRNISHERNGAGYLFNTKEPKFKQKLAEKLVADKNCPNEYIADIIGSIDSKQKELFKQLYTDNNIPKSELSSILYLDYGMRKGLKKLNFADKINVLTNSAGVSDTTLKYLEKYNIKKSNIDSLVDNISMEMGLKKENIPISEISRKKLFTNYIANNSNIEETITHLDLNKFKQGIPMKYPRSQFVKDIEALVNNLTPEDKTFILDIFKLNIENGKMEGFPLIPRNNVNIKKELQPIFESIKEKIINFTQKNESKIDNPDLKKILDSVIEGCPEFATVIGKVQHGTHQYTVDVHTLKVLQNTFKDIDYQKLDDESKTVLKFSILLHDIGKKESIVDKMHYETSAKFAVSILDRYKLPARVKSRIIETIYNHHWFEQYNKNEISADVVNAMFRDPKSLQIGMIMAKADLAGVSGDFHFRITKTHNIEDFNEFFDKKKNELLIQQNVRYKNSNMVIDTKFTETSKRKFPTKTVNVKGNNYDVKVLNLTDETLPDDLFGFGFAKGTTRQNTRFLAHFNDRIKGLKVFMALSSSPTTESVQSLSMISLGNSRAYRNQTYGVITDVDMANVAQASNTNIGSGYKKNLRNFAKDLFSFWQVNTYVRDNFINELDKAGINLTTEEYAQLSKKIIDIQYSSQIVRDIKIGDKLIPAKLLRNALNASRDKLFEGSSHSEIVAINPRVKALVARVSSIEECDQDFLELATENNLPIVLIGHNGQH